MYFSWTPAEQLHFSLSILILVQISPSFPIAYFSYNTLSFIGIGVSEALVTHNMELNIHWMRKDDKNCPKSSTESHCKISWSSHNDLSIVVEICLNLPDVRPTIIMLIMPFHRNVDQNVEPTTLLKKDMKVQCVSQLREKSFCSLRVYSFLLSVVLSVGGVILCKSFEADTCRNTSPTDRQKWLYSEQLHGGAMMEIHSQQKIVWTEKYLDRHPNNYHINKYLWRSRQTLKKKKKWLLVWSEKSFNTGKKRTENS